MSDSAATSTAYFITEMELRAFLSQAQVDRGPLIATVAESQEGASRSRFEKVNGETAADVCLRCPPPVESAKSFLFPVKERVATYPGVPSEPSDAGATGDQPRIIFGLRACDLLAIEILDQVLREGDYEDPFYAAHRDCTLLISTDCVAPAETCFCNLVGGKPYPDGGYDLNVTPVKDGYVVAIGSQAGKEIVLERAHSFKEATAEQFRKREEVRAACMSKLEKQSAPFKPEVPLDEVLSSGKDVSERWMKLAAACVECGGCNFVCPTCYCFLLYDQVSDGKADGAGDAGAGRFERIKAWDSCLLSSFARMAGVGGMKSTPRPELPSRFENRIRHKFEWLKENIGKLGCLGCGRCYEVCLGGIDVREVIKELGTGGNA